MTLHIPSGAFPLSTDSMVLAHFSKLPRNAAVLDLGSGCGTLGILLCAKDPGCRVCGVELSSLSHEAALDNIRRNALPSRMESICADLAQVPGLFAAGSFSVCISNPPYFSGGFVSSSHPLARQEESCPPETLMRAAGWVLKTGGDFFLVHKPERMAQMISLAAREQLECKRLCLVRHREASAPALALMAFRKGGKPGLILEEWTLYHRDGSPTELYKAIYHHKET